MVNLAPSGDVSDKRGPQIMFERYPIVPADLALPPSSPKRDHRAGYVGACLGHRLARVRPSKSILFVWAEPSRRTESPRPCLPPQQSKGLEMLPVRRESSCRLSHCCNN